MTTHRCSRRASKHGGTMTFPCRTSALAAGVLVMSIGSIAPVVAAAEDEPVVATGVVSRDGMPTAGVDVLAIALPNQASASLAADGDVASTRIVARRKTDRDGRFEIPLDPTELAAEQVGADGRVNMGLVVADEDREVRWNFTATRGGSGATAAGTVWSVMAADLAEHPRHADGRIDLGSQPTANESADPPGQWFSEDGASLSSTSPRPDAAAVGPRSDLFSPAAPCVAQWGDWHYGRNEAFLNVWAWSGALATVSHVNGVDHTLGVGVSHNGSHGSFRQSGTGSISLAAGGERGGAADATVWNRINYRDLRWTCSATVERRPINVYGVLTNFTYKPHVSFGACTPYTGGIYWKTRGRNVTYGAGMDMGPISVSAQSGHNSESKTAWTVRRRTKLCGSTAVGWASAPQASASAG
jgi:hypothetical protein